MDKVRNEVVRDMVGVVDIESKLRETGLRWFGWFGHVARRELEHPVRRCMKTILRERRRRGRLRKKWGLGDQT